MSTRTIYCQVMNEYVKGAGVPVGAAGSHDDVVLEISFSDFWDGLTKKITWLDATGRNAVYTLLNSSMLKEGETNTYLVPIPASPKAYAGDLTMTIKGYSLSGETETRATLTTSSTFRVLESAYDADAEQQGDISPTQAEQLQAEIDAVEESVAPVVSGEAARVLAESGRVSAESGRVSAESLRASAEQSRSAAETLRVSAESARAYCAAYSASRNYKIGEKAVRNGSTYQCISPCNGKTPPNSTYWICIAQKGLDGTGFGDMTVAVYDPAGKAQQFASAAEVALKADKKVPAAANNVPLLDANGNLADSGKQLRDLHCATLIVGASGHNAAECDYLCDGTADEAQINQAISDLPATGGKIYLLDGVYNLAANITVGKADVELHGTRASKIVCTATAAISVTAARCRLSGFAVEGVAAESRSTQVSAIVVSNAAKFVMDNMRVTKGRVELNTCTKSMLRDCIIGEGIGYSTGAFLTGGSGNSVIGCDLSGAYFCIEANRESHLLITGNTADRYNDMFVYLNSCNFVNVCANTAHTQIGGFIHAVNAYLSNNYVHIANNVFSEDTENADGDLIYIGNDNNYVSIVSNNLCTGTFATYSDCICVTNSIIGDHSVSTKVLISDNLCMSKKSNPIEYPNGCNVRDNTSYVI